jgi:hypothetical protein
LLCIRSQCLCHRTLLLHFILALVFFELQHFNLMLALLYH